MDIKSIIKNAVAQRLQESIKIEEPATPEITTTSEFVNFLAEAVKFKMEELKINKDISRETVGRMKKAGVSKEYRREATKDDVARAEGDRARKQKMKDDAKSGEGFERGVHVQKHGAAADADAAARRTGSTPISQINKMGVRKGVAKKHGGVSAGDAAENRLKAKTTAMAIKHGKEVADIASKEN